MDRLRGEVRRALVAIAAVATALAGAAPAQAVEPDDGNVGALANRCFTLAAVGLRGYVREGRGAYTVDASARRDALRFFLKPTGLGTFLLHDDDARLLATTEDGAVVRGAAPGAMAEWAPRGEAGRGLSVRSTATGRLLAVSEQTRLLTTESPPPDGRPRRFRFERAADCRRYPEAALNARGRTFRGTRRRGRLVGLADVHMHATAELRAGGQVIYGPSFHRFGITEALGRDEDVHGPSGALDFSGNLLRSGTPAGTHDTEGWPGFAGWPHHATYTHQQAYYRWLQRAWLAGLRLVVAHTVEDEPLCQIEPLRSHSCDETTTIELEVQRLRDLQDYVDAQSGGRGRGWFRLVSGPRAARRVIEQGKLAVVIGAESSNPFGCRQYRGEPRCDRDAIDRGIARLHRIGVRSIFPAHWVDNALAGAALEGGDKGTVIATMNATYTGRFFRTGPCPHPGQGEEIQPAAPDALSPLFDPVREASPESVPVYPPGRQCNRRSLTDLGTYAVQRLMDRGMLIEVDHLSEWARQRVLALAEARRYPLVSSHTGTGGTWAPAELRRLYAVGGFAAATFDAAGRLPRKVLALRRHGGPRAGVGLATDVGGFASLPGPETGPGGRPLRYPFSSYVPGVRFDRQRTGTRTFDLDADGVAHYGLLPDFLADVARRPGGRAALRVLFDSAETYLRTWGRAARR